MYPHERSLVRTLADKPFAIVGINSDKSPTIAKDVCVPKNISWRSFMNVQGDQKISDKWKVAGWPTTYLIDKDGVIRFKNLRGDKLDRAIEVLMAEMDIEIDLAEVDHEAEDKKAMEAYQEALEEEKEKDDDVAASESEEKSEESEDKEVSTSK